MSEYPDLIVLRHGETLWNAEGRMQGNLNSPLTQQGIKHACQQRRILETLDLRGYTAWVSPQGRAIETAGYAVAPLLPELQTDARLKEIGVGDWSGLLRTDLPLDSRTIDLGAESLDLYSMAPNGEGLGGLEARCAAFLRDLTGPTLVVTHGITGHMLRTLWMGWGMDRLGTLPGGQGVVFHLSQGCHYFLTEDAEPVAILC